MDISEGDAELKQEGPAEEKADAAEVADPVGEPEAVGNNDGPEDKSKMEEAEGGEKEAEGGGEKAEGGEEEAKGGEKEEEVGVKVKEEVEEPEGDEEPEAIDDVESLLQGADDDCGIPVIED